MVGLCPCHTPCTGTHTGTYCCRLPIRILKELLQTYSDSDASEAESLAKELIRLVISDPCTFVFDDLLELAPVKKLESQQIHKVSGRVFLYFHFLKLK